MIDKLRPSHSNEIESLIEFVRMIGGSKEYQQALIFAAYVRTFKHDLTVVLNPSTDKKTFDINVYPNDGFQKNLFQMELPMKYMWMFMEGWNE